MDNKQKKKAVFLLNNNKNLFTFIPRTEAEEKRIEDDGAIVKHILDLDKKGHFKVSMKNEPIFSIQRMVNGESEMIYYVPTAKASSSSRDEENEAAKTTDNAPKGKITTEAWSDDDDDSDVSDLEVQNPKTKVGAGLSDPKRANWTEEQEKFLQDHVSELHPNVGPRGRMRTEKEMFEVIADLFNEEFDTDRTAGQMRAKKNALVKREKENKSKRKQNVDKSTQRVTGVEKMMNVLRELNEEREKRREIRNAERKKEALEREDRFFARLKKLRESKED